MICEECGIQAVTRPPSPRIRKVLFSRTGMVAVFDEDDRQMPQYQGYARNPEDHARLTRLADDCDGATWIELCPGGVVSLATFRVWLVREMQKPME